MQQDDPDSHPIASADSAYLHWAQTLERIPDGIPRLHAALVRLRHGTNDPEAAQQRLAEAVAEGRLILDPDDMAHFGLLPGPEFSTGSSQGPDLPGDPFILYWSGPSLLEFQAHFADLLEILQPAHAILGTPPADLAAAPEAMPEGDVPTTHGPAKPIVAVIDDGIGFLNMRFCRRAPHDAVTAPYRTRFHAIWLQAFRTVPDPAYGDTYVRAGQVLHRREIDRILAQGPRLDEEAAYHRLNSKLYEPGAHRSTEYGFSHGTHVLDLAAGADPETADPALSWPLLAVQLPPEAVDNTAGTQLEPCIVEGVRWVLRQALRINDDSPVVINISFATFAGPKDGTKAIEAMIAFLADRWQAQHGRRVRVVYAFGNSRLHHQCGHIGLMPGKRDQITWRLLPEDFAASYLEIRPEDPADLTRLKIDLNMPGGPKQVLGPTPQNTYRPIRDRNGREVGRYYHLGPRQTAPGVITPPCGIIALAPSAGEPGDRLIRPGAWTVGVEAEGRTRLALRLEVQRGDTPPGYRLNGRQSYLDDPRAYSWDPETLSYTKPGPDCPITRQATHSSFVTARSNCLYCVGAALDLPELSPSPYSAEGAPWTRPGPTLAAIADRGHGQTGLVASGTYSGSGRVGSGTSVAAARVTRALATSLDDGSFPSPPGPPEIAGLVAIYGKPAAATRTTRQGAGILTGPRDPRAIFNGL